MIKLFVYGTLRDGCHNNRILKTLEAKKLDTITLEGYGIRLLDKVNIIPVLDKGEGKSIVGEVWELSGIPFGLSALEQGYELIKVGNYEGETLLAYYPAFDASSLIDAANDNGAYDYGVLYTAWALARK